MSIKQLKRYYHRFARWQQAVPHFANRHEGDVRRCNNCGTEFADNYCPRCGQRAELGRVGWRSIRENVALLWGLDSRSLGYTLIQLLGRPGYLVRDYISGHRQVSFPPVKMLVIVCVFVVLFEAVFHVKNDVLGLHFDIKEIDDVISWINSQKSWATLFIQSIYILPTWLVFRYAPRYPRHTLPEGFFLQVFLSVLNLLLVFVGYWNESVEFVLWLVYMCVTYHQLFGYGWWGTIWRLGVIILLAAIVALVAVVIVLYLYDDRRKGESILVTLYVVGPVALFASVILFITHLINKRTFQRDSNF